MPERITLVAYDREWPSLFAAVARRIQDALGDRALLIEHVGSTAVPGLDAKPIIDVALAVADSRDESNYLPPLQAAGFTLRLREPDWYEHRLFNASGVAVNLHVFPAGCPEIDRMVRFRDWLRRHTEDRTRYAETKHRLAAQEWASVNDYAAAKTEVVEQVLERAGATRA